MNVQECSWIFMRFLWFWFVLMEREKMKVFVMMCNRMSSVLTLTDDWAFIGDVVTAGPIGKWHVDWTYLARPWAICGLWDLFAILKDWGTNLQNRKLRGTKLKKMEKRTYLQLKRLKKKNWNKKDHYAKNAKLKA